MKTYAAVATIAIAVTFPSAANPSGESTSRALVTQAYSQAPATFESRSTHEKLSTELCFDRCYVFVGATREASAYWDFVLVATATIGKWNLPDSRHQELAAAAESIVQARADPQCKADRAACVALALSRQAQVRLSEVTRDEGNVCSVAVDLKRSFGQMKVVTSGPTRCKKASHG